MTFLYTSWPELRSIKVPEPPDTRSRPWGNETYEARYRRQHTDLLKAATRLVVEKGYRGTTVQDIVAVAKLSKRTFYEHFETRDECFRELIGRVSVSYLRNLIRYAESLGDVDPLEALERLLRREVEMMTSSRTEAKALMELRNAGPVTAEAFFETECEGGRFYEAVARQLGSTIPPEELSLTARFLRYALTTESYYRSPDQIDVPALAALWARAFGLSVPPSRTRSEGTRLGTDGASNGSKANNRRRLSSQRADDPTP